jgi:hypothetical protein
VCSCGTGAFSKKYLWSHTKKITSTFTETDTLIFEIDIHISNKIAEKKLKKNHLICHLILTKINSITLKIRSKADFKSKSQNI